MNQPRAYRALLSPRPCIESRSSRSVIVTLGEWHAEASTRTKRWMASVCRAGSASAMWVGLGDRRGMYLICSYGSSGEHELLSVAPGGLRGRRSLIEYDYDGNPHMAPVRCVVPRDQALTAIEYFLKHDALSLNVEWCSVVGLHARFLPR